MDKSVLVDPIMEISSNHHDSSSLSPVEEAPVPVPDSAYSQDEMESDNTHNVDVSESLEFGVPEPAQQMMKRESVDLSVRVTEPEPEPVVESIAESVADSTRSVRSMAALLRSANTTPE